MAKELAEESEDRSLSQRASARNSSCSGSREHMVRRGEQAGVGEKPGHRRGFRADHGGQQAGFSTAMSICDFFLQGQGVKQTWHA